MSIDYKFMKIKVHTDFTLLNIFHLIYKVDLLNTKVPKLRFKAAKQNLKLV
jgi:hypothetical protein